jgi:hypothetical protein
MTRKRGLPKQFRPLFWDHRFSRISIANDQDLIIRRILSIGSWDAVCWLRNEIGDESLREWLISHNGRGLTPRQLRFWGLIYDLPVEQVNKWVQNARSGNWANRRDI